MIRIQKKWRANRLKDEKNRIILSKNLETTKNSLISQYSKIKDKKHTHFVKTLELINTNIINSLAYNFYIKAKETFINNYIKWYRKINGNKKFKTTIRIRKSSIHKEEKAPIFNYLPTKKQLETMILDTSKMKLS